MALNTFSSFYYGYNIDDTNNIIPFSEGGDELSANIEIGAYTLTEFLVAVKTALDSAGENTYTASVDRSTRVITISSTGTFSLLVSSGTTIGTSPYQLMGFTGGSDLTGQASYSAPSASGYKYEPQFVLQDYVSPEDYQEYADASVNESSSGLVEVLSFGLRSFIEMNIKFITDIPQDGTRVKSNSTGVQDARQFFQYITQKFSFEFIPDLANPNTFYKVILESTPQSREGIGYKLRELYGRGMPGYFESGVITLRVVS